MITDGVLIEPSMSHMRVVSVAVTVASRNLIESGGHGYRQSLVGLSVGHKCIIVDR